MDSFNAVRIRACQRQPNRKVVCHWQSAPIAISRGPFESYEAAANRALAQVHYSLNSKFRRPHRHSSGPRAVIAHSQIRAHQAWLEAVLVNAPVEQCHRGPLTLLDLPVAA